MKKILITGPMGQDGVILTELLQNNYELYGACRVSSSIERVRKHSKDYNINLFRTELSDFQQVNKLVKHIKPNAIINFAGETDVISPWEDINNTFTQNFTIPLNFLNSIIKNDLDLFFFQSSSSLMYGRSNQKQIDENSKFAPMYPYGISKLSAHNLLNEYRLKYKIKCSSGIFFNHESHHRSAKFISKKLSSLVNKIINGNQEKIKLYDLNFYRDISHAEDFMSGVKLIIDNHINEDFIFSSGELTNIFEFSKKFFSLHNLNFYDYIDYTESNSCSNNYSIFGNNTKLKSIGWIPKYNIDSLIIDMVKKEKQIH